jgi:hypothetical protein
MIAFMKDEEGCLFCQPLEMGVAALLKMSELQWF